MAGKMEKLRSVLLLLAGFGLGGVPCASGAMLTGNFTPIPQFEVVNLTREGPLDWVHWGRFTPSSVDRKAGVTPQIPDFTPIGASWFGPYQFGDNFNGYSWIDGSPTPGVTNTTTGVWMYGRSKGFQLNIPIGTATNIVEIFVGTYGAVGKFDASFTNLGGTTLTYSDASITNVSNGPGGFYTVTCAADSPGQTLLVTYVVGTTFDSAGNVTLQAAALTAPGANHPPTVSIISPVAGANLSAHENLTLVADAADMDGTITRVEFFQGSTTLGESTDDSHSLTWTNVSAGKYSLTAKATDDSGATVTSAPVEIFVNGAGGSLSGATALPPGSVDLTAEGTSDWAHWGLISPASFDHKAAVPQQISNFTEIGTNYTDNYTAYSWNNGTPTASAIGTRTGVSIHGMTNGFTLTAPADTGARTFKVYVGLYGAQGDFQAYLSDFSAPAYTDTSSSSVFGSVYAVYTLNYTAASAGQTLRIKYTAK